MRPYDWLAMYRGCERLRELPRTYVEIHRRSLLRSRTFYSIGEVLRFRATKKEKDHD